ncbi:MAG: hypothetical protein JXB07_13350 [Anaerolineae bacterium]|nr:hypothetical protein [Anaerolineae bacterium]
MEVEIGRPHFPGSSLAILRKSVLMTGPVVGDSRMSIRTVDLQIVHQAVFPREKMVSWDEAENQKGVSFLHRRVRRMVGAWIEDRRSCKQ